MSADETWNDFPLTGSDLRVVADALDEVEATTLDANPVLGRIEVMRPDAYELGRIGWIRRFDDEPGSGWGFVADPQAGA